MTTYLTAAVSFSFPALDHVVTARQTVLDEVRLAHEALERAREAAASLELTCSFSILSQRDTIHPERCTDDELARPRPGSRPLAQAPEGHHLPGADEHAA